MAGAQRSGRTCTGGTGFFCAGVMGVVFHQTQCLEVMSLVVWQVLGGQVEELLEAWTFQRKFGNVQRPAGASEDMEQPPAFQSFVPGRRHNQAGHR